MNWSSSLAYALGLTATDGSLSKDGRHIIFRSSDLEQIQNFKEIFKLTNKIALTHNNGYAKKPTYRIQFGNVVLYRWLIERGFTPAKTYTIGKIDIPDIYFRDFVRGHLDGDGTIVTYLDCYNSYKGKVYENQRIFTKLISVSKSHVEWLHEKITQLTGIKGAIICNPRENKATLWELKYSKHASLQLFKWIYYQKDIFCLQRKRNIAERALESRLAHSS